MNNEESERAKALSDLERATSSHTAAYIMSKLPPNNWNELATKSDLVGLATKADLAEALADYPTKADLANYPTKADLANHPTKPDLAEALANYPTKAELAELRAEMHVMGADLRTEIHRSIVSQTRWILGYLTGWTGIVLAIATWALG